MWGMAQMSAGRRRQPGFGALMMFSQVVRVGYENIPPATLAFGAANLAMFYLDIGHFHPHDVCVGAKQVIYGHEFQRLLLGAFYHLDEMHLAYNMGSFLMKGLQMEPRFGPVKFGWMLLMFAVLSNLLLAILGIFALEFLHYPVLAHQCAAGFSAVLFALKVVMFWDSDQYHHVAFLPFVVGGKWVAWVELLLISLLIPQASFYGHLCGILVGLLYVSGVAAPLFDLPEHLIRFDDAGEDGRVPRGPRRGFYGAGAAGGEGFEQNPGAEGQPPPAAPAPAPAPQPAAAWPQDRPQHYERMDAYIDERGVLRRRRV